MRNKWTWMTMGLRTTRAILKAILDNYLIQTRLNNMLTTFIKKIHYEMADHTKLQINSLNRV